VPKDRERRSATASCFGTESKYVSSITRRSFSSRGLANKVRTLSDRSACSSSGPAALPRWPMPNWSKGLRASKSALWKSCRALLSAAANSL